MIKPSEIENKINIIRKNKQIIGLCHGVFDFLHRGHLLHFEAAKKNRAHRADYQEFINFAVDDKS